VESVCSLLRRGPLIRVFSQRSVRVDPSGDGRQTRNLEAAAVAALTTTTVAMPDERAERSRWVEIRISGAIPQWGGGKVSIINIIVTIRDSGWRLTVQEVLLICCVALWHY
jgi:hypothetical protein